MSRLWITLCVCLLASSAHAAPHILHLGQGRGYDLLAYANLAQPQATRAVIIVHGVRRNAEDYYRSGEVLLHNAGLERSTTLLLAPNFLTTQDPLARDSMPLWPKDGWMQGSESSAGQRGIAAFSVLDDLLAYLADRQRYPHLKEIVLIGHSAGAQLMQRYALLGTGDQRLQALGIKVRYGVSSPSSYLYLDPHRPQGDGFTDNGLCADYNRYRYGLEQPPAYLTRQRLDARQLLQRYAARDVTYLVGARDTHADSKVMDHRCGAQVQGRNRVERQLGYMRYEAFLSQAWGVAIAHRQFLVPGVGHSAAQLFAAPAVAHQLF
ncbi:MULTISPECIES: alpha/beta fold hydrolase [Pseudomonas]|uniref:AB hydrolase-1 domain-containing protein n=1 Tax=Pseudomonas mosselii TaxID=78327 RepID=A0A5R8YN33_9PSED|nr:alpha/beta fold hydrolase [Pseudomonas mosselii]TLP53941.1 hypothetical protein FEM01_22540 [Pseudomonas mosselii]